MLFALQKSLFLSFLHICIFKFSHSKNCFSLEEEYQRILGNSRRSKIPSGLRVAPWRVPCKYPGPREELERCEGVNLEGSPRRQCAWGLPLGRSRVSQQLSSPAPPVWFWCLSSRSQWLWLCVFITALSFIQPQFIKPYPSPVLLSSEDSRIWKTPAVASRYPLSC